MVLINGRKFACEACIRGHRASSCAHTGRQLQLVRPKGRPSSQCEICRAKRATGSFHGRCDCTGRREEGASTSGRDDTTDVETFTPYAGSSGSGSQDGYTDGLQEGAGSGRGRHSLEALMNPCECRSTGICTCCSRASSSSMLKGEIGHGMGENGTMTCGTKKASLDAPAACGCNGGDKCCDDEIGLVISEDAHDPQTVRLTTTRMNESVGSTKASCCAGKAKSGVATSSLPELVSSESSTTAEQTAIMHPECHCGPECSCPGCLNEGDKSQSKQSSGNHGEECPDKCLTCSACVLGLTRPSGIDVIDQWMDEDRAARAESDNVRTADDARQTRNAREQDEGKEAARKEKRARREVGRREDEPFKLPHPPLPPFPKAKEFFDQHFVEDARRKFFSDRMNQQPPSHTLLDSTSTAAPVTPSLPYGKRLPGESDEEWQARYGFSFLTPDAVEIFDRARQFKEQRRRAEEAEVAQTTALEEAKTNASVELAHLRQKALMARKSTTSAS